MPLTAPRRFRPAVYLLLLSVCAVWGTVIYYVTSGLGASSSSSSPPAQLRATTTTTAAPVEPFPHRRPMHFTPVRNPQAVEFGGFANPNRLPKLIAVGPPSFFHILAPPYYGKSPMDGTRNYAPGSAARAKHCRAIGELPHGDFPMSAPMCSYGPELVFPLKPSTASMDNVAAYSAHLLHDVCLTFNLDSMKQVQRGLVYFDPQNAHEKRCVPCPNPIEFRSWGEHACGVMWNHQINARSSLADYSQCYQENVAFIRQIGQRQTPPERLVGGFMHRHLPVLELSFAHSNPGHQCFDSLLSLLPILFPVTTSTTAADDEPYQVVVHQNPTCPDDEWLCGVLRRMGFFAKHELVQYDEQRVPCFANLIVPKWGMARETVIPAALLQRLQRELHQSFFGGGGSQRKSSHAAQRDGILLYAHDTVSVEVKQQRRIWEGMRDIVNSDLGGDALNINVVDDFAKMTVEQQAEAFYHASALVMPHGGQFGNAVFARRGTVMVELGCVPYSHLGMTSSGKELLGSVPRALGFIHLVVVPCDCDTKDVDSNFRFGPKSVRAVLELAKSYEPGTHLVRSSADKRCFGSKE